MFARTSSQAEKSSFSKSRKGKSKSSFREHAVSKSRYEKPRRTREAEGISSPRNLTSPIITLVIGREQRLFAAHEEILFQSPFFEAACRNRFNSTSERRLALPDEEPEIFSSVLEYMYKGDYHPRLLHNTRRNTFELERNASGGRDVQIEPTIYQRGVGGEILKDTVIYCRANKYGLEDLKKIALRKQGLQCGIQCSTILSSARYAYAHTPDSDSKLRAHYLALIIRSRSTFKRSGTMQMEMNAGGSPLFFDLFVALCNHVDDVASVSLISITFRNTPRSTRHS